MRCCDGALDRLVTSRPPHFTRCGVRRSGPRHYFPANSRICSQCILGQFYAFFVTSILNAVLWASSELTCLVFGGYVSRGCRTCLSLAVTSAECLNECDAATQRPWPCCVGSVASLWRVGRVWQKQAGRTYPLALNASKTSNLETETH
jgi:hypothetical protein